MARLKMKMDIKELYELTPTSRVLLEELMIA
jgi:hypothetical protein